MEKVLTQEEIVSQVLPTVKNGTIYQKFTQVWVRPAVDGELIGNIHR